MPPRTDTGQARGKGRTARRRRKRCDSERAANVSCEPNLVQLVQWMHRGAWRPSCRLQPAVFPDTGRGLLTRQTIVKDEVIFSIPETLMITSRTVMNSPLSRVFEPTCDANELAGSDATLPSCQQVLATFLAVERGRGAASPWHEYLASLPSTFSTPLYLQSHELVPPYVAPHVSAVTRAASAAYAFVKSRVAMSWREFVWGWSVVNSRAVYLDRGETSDVIRDRDCLALAPLLDLLNHSPGVHVNEVRRAGGCYQLLSSASFQPYDQVLISYGVHDNLTLCLEYGFVLAHNPHDQVLISAEDVASALHVRAQCPLSCTSEGLTFSAWCEVASCVGESRNLVYRNERVRRAVAALISHKSSQLLAQRDAMAAGASCSDSFAVLRQLLDVHIALLREALAQTAVQ